MSRDLDPTGTDQQRSPSRLNRFFGVAERGSTVARELRGGVTTFVTMSYIVLLNPLILGSAADVTGARLDHTQLTTATALSAGVMTLLMGLVGRAPLALAAGLGVNAVIAFTVAPSMTWPQAFGLAVLEGACIVAMTVSGVRERLINAVPAPLKSALTIGIGLYIALIGLVSAGFVSRKPDSAHTTTPVQMGTGADGHLHGWPLTLFCATMLLMIALVRLRKPAAILISIATGTLASVGVNAVFPVPAEQWGVVVPTLPTSLFATPDFGLVGHVDLVGGFATAGAVAATTFLFTLVLSGFFDAMGTITSVGRQAGLTSDGSARGMGRILLIDGAGAVAGGLTGSAPNAVFLESAAGVGEGARTGLASLVTGSLFLVTMLFAPIASIVPAQAAAPALVLVGGMMMIECRHVPWTDPDYVLPVFLTAAVIPFTYSITNGVGAGLIAYCTNRICRGQIRDLDSITLGIAALFVLYFGIDVFPALFG